MTPDLYTAQQVKDLVLITKFSYGVMYFGIGLIVGSDFMGRWIECCYPERKANPAAIVFMVGLIISAIGFLI